jgi:hypothetical protein
MIYTCGKFVCNGIQHGGALTARISGDAGKHVFSKLRFGARGLPLTINQTSLPPAQAVSTLNERIKRIARVNVEIADWLLV